MKAKTQQGGIKRRNSSGGSLVHGFQKNPKCYRPPGLTWGCPDPGLNRGPLDLQSNALPTELSRPVFG